MAAALPLSQSKCNTGQSPREGDVAPHQAHLRSVSFLSVDLSRYTRSHTDTPRNTNATVHLRCLLIFVMQFGTKPHIHIAEKSTGTELLYRLK